MPRARRRRVFIKHTFLDTAFVDVATPLGGAPSRAISILQVEKHGGVTSLILILTVGIEEYVPHRAANLDVVRSDSVTRTLL